MITDVGRFLTELSARPKIESIDELSIFTLDVRQDAATRAWLALTRKGIAVTDTNFASLLNAHRDVAFGALKFSLINEIQKKRRRNTIKALLLALGQARLKDASEKQTRFLHKDEASKLEWAVLNEPHFDDCLDYLETDDSLAELHHMFEHGSKDEREAICMLIYILRCKEEEQSWSTPYNRMRLARLRKRTGWALDTKVL